MEIPPISRIPATLAIHGQPRGRGWSWRKSCQPSQRAGNIRRCGAAAAATVGGGRMPLHLRPEMIGSKMGGQRAGMRLHGGRIGAQPAGLQTSGRRQGGAASHPEILEAKLLRLNIGEAELSGGRCASDGALATLHRFATIEHVAFSRFASVEP